MASDIELLRSYVEEGSEAAFAEVVRLHLNLVYFAALRQLGGDVHRAQDVAQTVFSDLARKAPSLVRRATLTGWLHTSTRFAAAMVRRSDATRQKLARQIESMQPIVDEDESNAEWGRLRPLIDEAIHGLSERDREAVLLRVFETRPFAEIGATLGLSEDAARMRVERALEKLRTVLARRGVTSTTAALGVALANQAALAAPPGLATVVASTAVAGAAGGGFVAALAASFVKSKVKIGIAAAVIIAGATVAVREVRATRLVESEIERLRALPQELTRLRADNERISNIVAKAVVTNPDAAELARLSQRLAQLKARPEGVLDSEMKPLPAFQNVGRNTPLAAMETQLWARANGDDATFAQLLGFTDRSKARLDAFFAALPDDVRNKFGTPKRMLAPMAAWGRLGPPAAVQILGQTDHGLKVIVHAWARYAAGHEGKMDLMLQRFEDGWRVPHTDDMMEGIIASLDPATGEFRPRTK
jgi:RNA polymerase sigma factor (sigma-70 family)